MATRIAATAVFVVGLALSWHGFGHAIRLGNTLSAAIESFPHEPPPRPRSVHGGIDFIECDGGCSGEFLGARGIQVGTLLLLLAGPFSAAVAYVADRRRYATTPPFYAAIQFGMTLQIASMAVAAFLLLLAVASFELEAVPFLAIAVFELVLGRLALSHWIRLGARASAARRSGLVLSVR